jgi:hypothetical protein
MKGRIDYTGTVKRSVIEFLVPLQMKDTDVSFENYRLGIKRIDRSHADRR